MAHLLNSTKVDKLIDEEITPEVQIVEKNDIDNDKKGISLQGNQLKGDSSVVSEDHDINHSQLTLNSDYMIDDLNSLEDNINPDVLRARAMRKHSVTMCMKGTINQYSNDLFEYMGHQRFKIEFKRDALNKYKEEASKYFLDGDIAINNESDEPENNGTAKPRCTHIN